jgi:diphosphomevalonate decarboxylase
MTHKIIWNSPSNIAIIKYWGKNGFQIPMNPSLSFTLSACKTETSIEFFETPESNQIKFSFLYDGQPKPEFEKKINKFLNALLSDMPWLTNYKLIINSVNTFPHSAGIASSASAMSALALCLVTHEQEILQQRNNEDSFFRKASFIARIGSGSASRSVFPIASVWGSNDYLSEASDEYAIPVAHDIHPRFHNLIDCIFLVNRSEKKISSTAGHQLMENHPFRECRLLQAHKNMEKLLKALKEGDWMKFSDVCEEEALSLHGLMMSSKPGYILLEPESLHLISEIQQFRYETQLPLCFTIDAGPNLHLLFPEEILEDINQWIRRQLPDYWNHKKIIMDRVGTGPQGGIIIHNE